MRCQRSLYYCAIRVPHSKKDFAFDLDVGIWAERGDGDGGVSAT
jgi:hypothetical protein